MYRSSPQVVGGSKTSARVRSEKAVELLNLTVSKYTREQKIYIYICV